jgi:MFS transporter, MHS family, proline/betaine transporter
MIRSRYAVVFTCLGSFLEWAEYTCYAYLAYHLSQLFFPPNAPYALIIAYTLMAFGYLIRPIGALVFGTIGDRYGRKPALMLSMLLLGISTACMGLLPIYETAGTLGAFLLALCRIIQGFAVGGELNGATLYLMEQSPPNTQTQASSWVSSSVAAGVVTGGLIAMLVSWPGMPAWAWRAPFICAGALCGISWYFRSNTLIETLERPSQPRKGWPIQQVLKKYKPAFFKTMAAGFMIGAFLYLNNVYLVSYLIQVGGWEKHQATFIALIAEAWTVIGILKGAQFCDHHPQHARTVLKLGVFLAPLGTAFIFMQNTTVSYWGVAIIWVVFPLINSLLSAPVFKYVFDCFPDKQVRFSGISVGWTIGAALSSFIPLFAQFTVVEWPLLVPVSTIFCASLLMLFSMRRSKK